MKIRSVWLRNLHSLRGDHRVDFTAEPLAGAGLFAITGPTGAGKTTLLDAITLALFGRAARYGNSPSPDDVMSRHCGECSAEVEFEVPRGIFRARWSLHRAHNRADGAVQAAQRTVADANGQVLAQQVREVAKLIEQLIGMDADRFQRSVLLAQGDFARFLKSNANERAALLESLTGTEIYSQLSAGAFERAGAARTALAAAQGAAKAVTVLTDEQRSELQHQRDEATKRITDLDKEIHTTTAAIAEANELEAQLARLVEAWQAREDLDHQLHVNAPDLARLQTHRRTQPLAEVLEDFERASAACTTAHEQLGQARENQARTQADHRKASLVLDRALSGALASAQHQRAQAIAEVANNLEQVKTQQAWLDDHRADQALVPVIDELTTRNTALQVARQKLSTLWIQWAQRVSEAVEPDHPDLESLSQEADTSTLPARVAAWVQAGDARGAALQAVEQEARHQKALRDDHLRKTELIATLDQHRGHLLEGEPCPLCGAASHPWATDAPDPGLEAVRTESRKAADALTRASQARAAQAKDLAAMRRDQAGLLDAGLAVSKASQELEALLQPLGLELPAAGQESVAATAWRRRVDEWGRREGLRDQAKQNGGQAEAEVARMEISVTDLIKLQASLRDAAGLVQQALDVDPVPNATQPMTKALSTLDEANLKHDEAAQQHRDAQTQLNLRIGDAKTRSEVRDDARRALEAAITGSEFTDIQALTLARLPATDVTRITEIESQFIRRQGETSGLLSDAVQKALALRERGVHEGDAAAALRQSAKPLKDDRDAEFARQSQAAEQLRLDDEAQANRRDRMAAIEAARGKAERWSRLNALIGAANGAPFRNFAQGLTLDVLTRRANRHLARLSDRYRIRRKEDEPLDLEIEDLHQAGVRRPMQSLSGGERFLASLALALGLSDLAGRNVRIDSLFIDEGFGTLDPETLEVAIAALEGLRQQGKTIGVISHVELLKERIGTQIVVERRSGGTSTLRLEPKP